MSKTPCSFCMNSDDASPTFGLIVYPKREYRPGFERLSVTKCPTCEHVHVLSAVFTSEEDEAQKEQFASDIRASIIRRLRHGAIWSWFSPDGSETGRIAARIVDRFKRFDESGCTTLQFPAIDQATLPSAAR